jgi:hypothetical protein
MVFEPTFDDIDAQADELPDLGGDGVPPAEPAIGTDGDDASHDDETAAADVDGAAAVAGADVEEDDLPPYGAA